MDFTNGIHLRGLVTKPASGLLVVDDGVPGGSLVGFAVHSTANGPGVVEGAVDGVGLVVQSFGPGLASLARAVPSEVATTSAVGMMQKSAEYSEPSRIA